jgi:hypothetical protein
MITFLLGKSNMVTSRCLKRIFRGNLCGKYHLNVETKISTTILQVEIGLTRSNISIGASNCIRRPQKISILNKLGQAKIGNIRLKFKTDEDVIGLDVSMNNWRDTIMV